MVVLFLELGTQADALLPMKKFLGEKGYELALLSSEDLKLKLSTYLIN